MQKTRQNGNRGESKVTVSSFLLKQLRQGKVIQVAYKKNRLVIHRQHHPRARWADQFRKMATRGDDKMLDEPTTTKFDQEDWEW